MYPDSTIRKILTADWSYYDNRKKIYADSRYFTCVQSWEVDFLVNLILKTYPSCSIVTIRKAIAESCKTVPAPRQRVSFVTNVMMALEGKIKMVWLRRGNNNIRFISSC